MKLECGRRKEEDGEGGEGSALQASQIGRGHCRGLCERQALWLQSDRPGIRRNELSQSAPARRGYGKYLVFWALASLAGRRGGWGGWMVFGNSQSKGTLQHVAWVGGWGGCIITCLALPYTSSPTANPDSLASTTTPAKSSPAPRMCRNVMQHAAMGKRWAHTAGSAQLITRHARGRVNAAV